MDRPLNIEHDYMLMWRDGLLSDAECLGWLTYSITEVQEVMLQREADEAEKRLAQAGIILPPAQG